jgi:hypothetical protein
MLSFTWFASSHSIQRLAEIDHGAHKQDQYSYKSSERVQPSCSDAQITKSDTERKCGRYRRKNCVGSAGVLAGTSRPTSQSSRCGNGDRSRQGERSNGQGIERFSVKDAMRPQRDHDQDYDDATHAKSDLHDRERDLGFGSRLHRQPFDR